MHSASAFAQNYYTLSVSCLCILSCLCSQLTDVPEVLYSIVIVVADGPMHVACAMLAGNMQGECVLPRCGHIGRVILSGDGGCGYD